jgi:glucokinase
MHTNETAKGIVVIDIGGSGVKLATFIGNELSEVQRKQTFSIDEFIAFINVQSQHIQIKGIGISVSGCVQGDTGIVLSCGVAQYLVGNLKEIVVSHFPTAEIHIVNDGEAHALALLKEPNIRLGAINLAIGTAVGLGVIDKNGHVVRTLSDENWEISALKVNTLTSKTSVWWALGQKGLKELVDNYGEKGYEHFGCCLGSFASHLAMIFRPNTICFSGGHIVKHCELFEKAVFSRFTPPRHTSPQLIFQKHGEQALIGLTTLFNIY